MRIDYDGFTIGGDGSTPDSNGAIWMVTEMDGWSGPGIRQTHGYPTGQDGSILVESLLDNRFISIRGICKAGTESGFWLAYNGLIALTNNINSTRELVVYESIPKMVRCYRADSPVINFSGVATFAFELSFTAPDPLKYNLDIQTQSIGPGSVATVTNNGSYYTAPTIVAGGTVDVLHENTGGRLRTRTGVTVPAGTTFVHRTKEVVSGNANYYDALDSSSTWWRLGPGPNSVRNLGSSTIQIQHRSASL